jgi:hypothetical protein
MNVSIEHGNSPTLTYVTVGAYQFAFSYETIVGFNDGSGWVKSENVWSKTTAKHLNEIPARGVKHEEFKELLSDFLDRTAVSEDNDESEEYGSFSFGIQR